MDRFAYVEPSVVRYAYVEQLYLLLVVSRKEKLEKMDSAVEVFSNVNSNMKQYSAMMTSACLLRKAMSSNDDVSMRISNYDVETDEGETAEVEKAEEEIVEMESVEKDTNEAEKDEEEKDEKTTDSEDTEPLSKVLKLTETSQSDEESMPIDEILKQIPEDMLLPSTMAEEPNLIKFSRVKGADPKPARLVRPFISRHKKPLPQRPFADDFAPICVFIKPVQDLDSRRPCSAIVLRYWAEICTDVVQFSLFGHLQPVGSVNFCRDIVAVDSDLETETIPTGIFDAFQHGQSAEGFVDFFVQQISDSLTSSSPISSSLVRVLPVLVRLLPDQATAQLRASIDKIQLEQVQTRERVEELKSELSQNITKLELSFAQSTSRQYMVFRAQLNGIQKERARDKRRKRIVEVHILKTEADLVEVEVVEAEVNHHREEVVRTE
ncbi:hypothetical protein F511_37302 [Dorcoceras hygrometricum]|uniref:Uncharacterized protein n=1 Tax=Dorcoceras hygrometricum TaxID=472368 RepID=A0A2Z7BED0_9LAMI|nr:hypothetical protein F511_37302 [Dorcoceras hygrometricum]